MIKLPNELPRLNENKKSAPSTLNDAEKKYINNVLSQNIQYTARQGIIDLLADDNRNLDEECGYPTTITINDYQILFERNGIGSRIIRLWPEESWIVTPEVVEDDEKDATAFEKEWKELEKTFHIYSNLLRVDILSGIGQFGVLLLGLSDGKGLDEEVEGDKHDLLYIKPLSQYVIKVSKTDTDVTSKRYGLPVIYTLKTESLEGEINQTEILVHYTRVVHITDNRMVGDVYGIPRAQPVYNYVIDTKKLLGPSAEMFYKGAFPGIAFEATPERTKPLTTAERTSLRSEFLNYSNSLQRYLALVGVTVKNLEVQVASPTDHFMSQLKAISITIGVPYRKLMGSEEAKLASNEDTKTWNKRVVKRQNDYVSPFIIRAVIDRFIELGVLSEPKEYTVKWPSIEGLDPKDSATVLKDRTEAMIKYVSGGVEVLMPPQVFLTEEMGFNDDEAEAILKEADLFVDDKIDEDELDEDDGLNEDGQ